MYLMIKLEFLISSTLLCDERHEILGIDPHLSDIIGHHQGVLGLEIFQKNLHQRQNHGSQYTETISDKITGNSQRNFE